MAYLQEEKHPLLLMAKACRAIDCHEGPKHQLENRLSRFLKSSVIPIQYAFPGSPSFPGFDVSGNRKRVSPGFPVFPYSPLGEWEPGTGTGKANNPA
jgi:hypothetical protein